MVERYSIGSVVGDCPEDNCGGAVIYNGGSDAECVNCHKVYEVEFEESEQVIEEASAVTPVESEDIPNVPNTAPNLEPAFDVDEKVTRLVDQLTLNPELQKKQLTLDTSTVGIVDGHGVSQSLQKSRAWAWAHKFGKTGNPYREYSKNWRVFNHYEKTPSTVGECAVEIEKSIGDALSYLLTVYEVTQHCLVAGLLVMDPKTRKISLCQGRPVAVKIR